MALLVCSEHCGNKRVVNWSIMLYVCVLYHSMYKLYMPTSSNTYNVCPQVASISELVKIKAPYM